jgi:threonine dehydratase
MADRSALETLPLPTLEDIRAAAARLAPVAVKTPLLRSPALDRLAGGTVLIKPELLQRTGSFKFRGAYNKISRIARDQRSRGVVAFSSGNHAQGVAAAAQLLGAPATIVMPSDAPTIKIENTRGYGAEVVLYDRDRDDREAIAAEIEARTGATLVPPYDDPDIVAGQGTIGLELVEQATAIGRSPDLVLAPCSGGGLMAGIATAMKALSPRTELMTVEPEGFDDMARSLASGRRERNQPGRRSLCDALMSPTPGILTFRINRQLTRGGLFASDAEVQRAIAFAFRELKLVVEPGGAVPLAVLLAGKVEAAGRTVALVLSGGNVDRSVFCAALEAAEARASGQPEALLDGGLGAPFRAGVGDERDLLRLDALAVHALALALEARARFDGERLMDDVALHLRAAGQGHRLGVDAPLHGPRDAHGVRRDRSAHGRRVAHGQRAARHIPVDRAVDLDVARALDRADDLHVGADDRGNAGLERGLRFVRHRRRGRFVSL